MPRALSSDRSRTLSASVKAFSASFPSRPPVSSPPCAASSTTIKRACCGAAAGAGTGGAAGGACAAAARLPPAARTASAPAPRRIPKPALLQRIDSQAAQQLGEKVGGLLRHHIACKSHFPQLLHGYRV